MVDSNAMFVRTAADAGLDGSPYVGYAYAYPHKTAYRSVPLTSVAREWRDEGRDALFLYVHLPFCSSRCGYCNLLAINDVDLIDAYLAALKRQADVLNAAFGQTRFARLAIGGGTPTLLNATQLRRLFAITECMGASPASLPVSVEASPQTISVENLALLRDLGVSRLSVGVQTFVDAEAKQLGRACHRAQVTTALTHAVTAGFPTLNIDLIYGGSGQTVASWLESLHAALTFAPQELYLYPLYVRRFTGLETRHQPTDAHRLALYRAGRDLLRARGYAQISMRMFRRVDAPEQTGPVYRCQEDGMVGLGVGARSYTSRLHYSSKYAVQRQNIRLIVRDLIARDEHALGTIAHGYRLDMEDRRRRYVIKSLLQASGMCRADYERIFGGDVLSHFPELVMLVERGWATLSAMAMRLTEAGLERSDAIGPWLYSAKVRQRMESYRWS